MQFVRLVNKDDRPFDFHQANQKRILQPGEEAMVPWDIATTLFGDPATIDTPLDQARTRVLKQARGQFNYETGNMTADEWEELRPKVEVYDVESGDRIFMVIEDESGAKFSGTPTPDANAANAAALTDQIALLQRQVDMLVQLQLNSAPSASPQGQSPLHSQDAPDDQVGALTQDELDDEAGEDTPQTPPVGGAMKPPKKAAAKKAAAPALAPKP